MGEDPTMGGTEVETTIVRRRSVATAQQPIEHALLLTEAGGAVRRVPLGPRPIRIGRVPGNDLVLASPEVSRSHCTVTLAGGRAVLSDPGSTNGTFVEGERVTETATLADGAHIHIGPFVLSYRSGTAEQLQRAESLEQELRRASAYIEAVLPAPIADGPVRTAWRFLPSTTLGGDGFGYHALPDGRFCVWLLDVNGHGVGSALLAVSVMNVLRQPVPAGVGSGDPAAVISALNAMFQMDAHGGLCFSLWYGVFDPAKRSILFASAGQHPGYLAAPGRAPAPLMTRNMMIGAVPDMVFREAEAPVPRGSRLFLFSDGAFEVTGRDGRQLGLPDFLPLLAAPADPGMAEPERLFSGVRAMARPGPFDDDIALLVVDFA